jgi:hypothetical protein
MAKSLSARRTRVTNLRTNQVHIYERQFDVGLISPFGPREARPKRRKIVPCTECAERFSHLSSSRFMEKVRILSSRHPAFRMDAQNGRTLALG